MRRVRGGVSVAVATTGASTPARVAVAASADTLAAVAEAAAIAASTSAIAARTSAVSATTVRGCKGHKLVWKKAVQVLQDQHPSQVRAHVWRVRGGVSVAVATTASAGPARVTVAASTVAVAAIASAVSAASVRGCKGHELV